MFAYYTGWLEVAATQTCVERSRNTKPAFTTEATPRRVKNFDFLPVTDL
ncbi:hypothetical protein [Nostoc sp. TCL240-02]|nr:hypothetical protein [Nostoc sp. TCL240-02]